MDFSLTANHQQLRQEIVRFARDELNQGVVERDEQQIFSRPLWRKCGLMGLQGLPVPKTYGGRGLDPLSTAIALEALGYGCHDSGLVFAIGAHILSCVVPVWKHGSEEQKSRYLPGLCNGELLAANGMSEPGSGSDAFSMRTKADREGQGFRLNGTKTFISNGPAADLALVYAVTDPEKGYVGGVTAFLVERGLPGFDASRDIVKIGLQTAPFGQLVFTDVFVPADAVLGRVGAGAMIFAQSMDWERICLFASHIGTSERLLERAVEHTRNRSRCGWSSGMLHLSHHRIADMKTRLEVARFLTYRAAWHLDQCRTASLDACLVKLYVSDMFVSTAQETLQILGGGGCREGYEVERALGDAIGSQLYSGTSEMQRNVIARWLGL